MVIRLSKSRQPNQNKGNAKPLPHNSLSMPLYDENEDLFEDTRMSFGEHLEELRKVLIRSLIGVAVGCVVGFLFAERVVHLLQRPLENALTRYYVMEGGEKLRSENGYLPPEYDHWLNKEQKIPETVLVDPAELVQALQAISPAISAAPASPPFRFRADDFDRAKLPLLCADWSQMAVPDEVPDQAVAPGEVVRKQWQLLWGLMPVEDQQLITRIGAMTNVSTAAVAELAEVLNRLLAQDEIHESEWFAGLIESKSRSYFEMMVPNQQNPLPEMKRQLQQNYAPGLSQQINRMLISRSLGLTNSGMQVKLTPITIWKSARYRAQSLGATETFMIWVKAGVVTGLILASPWVFYQLWTFVAAGLYPTEQRYVHVFLPISLLLFFSGALLAFFFVFEPVLDFLFSFNARMGISPHPRINDWLSFVLFLPLGFGLAFQLPLVMLFANRTGLISIESMTGKWRIAVVAIFGLSMLLTPADPVSMIMLAFPLTGLYFLGILLCRWFNQPTDPYYDPVTQSDS